MKYLICFLITLSFLISCGGSGGSDNDKSAQEQQDEPITLEDVGEYKLKNTEELLQEIESRLQGLTIKSFFTQAFFILSERSHEGIISDGQLDTYSIDAPHLDNVSDEYDEQTDALKQKILSLLLAYPKEGFSATAALTDNEQVSLNVFRSYLESELERSEYRHFNYPATYGNFGLPKQTERFFTDLIPVSTKEEAELYLTLANQVERRIDQINNLLKVREQAGIIEPRITLDFSKNDVVSISNSLATNISYYQAFNEKLLNITSISTEDKNDMRERLRAIVNQKIIPAYQRLAATMTDLVTKAPENIGFGQFEGGDEFYQSRLRYFTNSDMTPDEIHQLGLDELARIHVEMRELFDQLGYPEAETIAQLYARVDKDGGTVKGEDAVEFYEDIIAQSYLDLPEAFHRLPLQQVVVIGGDNGGFYIAGSDDGTRPGAFYAYTAGDLAYTTMPTLTYHEALPGHHLQIALAREANLPLFRRYFNFTSYVEGWGLYAERLAKDLGWYENDIYGDLGRLQFEAMRASRLVLDTGIHAKGWSYAESEQFSLNNVGNSGSIARYSVWPGQATAYTIGMLKILALRDQAERALGDKYDIRDFHSAVLENGSMPLNVLENVIEQYISSVVEEE